MNKKKDAPIAAANCLGKVSAHKNGPCTHRAAVNKRQLATSQSCTRIRKECLKDIRKHTGCRQALVSTGIKVLSVGVRRV